MFSILIVVVAIPYPFPFQIPRVPLNNMARIYTKWHALPCSREAISTDEKQSS